MLCDEIKDGFVRKVKLNELARLTLRGGWPENIRIIPENYIEAIVTKDMHESQTRKRSSEKIGMLIRAFARHESTVAGDKTLVRDIENYENESELIGSRETVADYTYVLDSLYLSTNQEAISVNYRSFARVGKSVKRHLVDSSLSCAVLHLTEEKLLNYHKTFGLMFEALVERDLRIYADYLNGHLYHNYRSRKLPNFSSLRVVS